MKKQDLAEDCWTGVLPAITTPFTERHDVDLELLVRHANWMIDAGCKGIIALGSLGEGGTLDGAERRAVLQALVQGVGERAPVVATIAAMSTREAVRQMGEAEELGCAGLMVLPPYVYRANEAELVQYFQAVIGSQAGRLPSMLYNNPIAYQVDIPPCVIVRLAESCPRLRSVKESSGDVRRITELRGGLRGDVVVLVGVDDLAVEGVLAGADGWVAGLVNAFPRESVRLFELARRARQGDSAVFEEMKAIYMWFLPLLRFDVGREFVQLIKLAQQAAGMGSARVRTPRLPLDPEAERNAVRVIAERRESWRCFRA